MSTKKKIGIWMDHSEAHLMDYEKESFRRAIIANSFTKDEEEIALQKSEYLMHNKRQQHEAGYYKEIGNEISNYKEVLLFGPTDAKSELHNVLKADLKFENIKIKVKAGDQMTDNQKLAFVNSHFSTHK